MGLGQGIGRFLIRDTGQNQFHVHSPLRREFQRRLHLSVQDQIGRHNMHIFSGTVQDIHIHPLPHQIVIQRAVAVGHHIAGSVLLGHGRIFQESVKLQFLLLHPPHLQKHQGKTPGRLPLEHHCRILPVTMLLSVIDILIRQINPSRECRMAVDHQNLAVVAVIVMGGYERGEGRKHLAFDAQLLQALRIIVRQSGELAGTVIHNADLHSLRRFSGQYLQYLAPHQTLVHNKIFQKNIVARLFQLPQHLLPFFLPHGKIGHCSVLKHRVAAASLHIAHQRRRTGIFLFQPAHGLRLLANTSPGLGGNLVHPAFDQAVSHLALGKPKQKRAEYRHQHYNDQPCDFGSGI